jgi:hypothetical protein
MTTTAATIPTTSPQRTRRPAVHVTGLVLTGFIALFLGFDSVTHLLRVDMVVEYNDRIGAPASFPVVCGAVLAACLVLYLLPRTAPIGAVLLTGYLGGAIATNLVCDMPLFNSFFALAVGVVVWAGLWPRDARVRTLYGR